MSITLLHHSPSPDHYGYVPYEISSFFFFLSARHVWCVRWHDAVQHSQCLLPFTVWGLIPAGKAVSPSRCNMILFSPPHSFVPHRQHFRSRSNTILLTWQSGVCAGCFIWNTGQILFVDPVSDLQTDSMSCRAWRDLWVRWPMYCRMSSS